MNAVDLYRSLQGFLQFSSRLVSATGQDVNEGETFTMRLTVKNVASAITLDDPVVIFTGLGYVVQGGAFARIAPNSALSEQGQFPDERLDPGDSTSTDIAMIALQRVSRAPVTQPIATATIFGGIDLASFFRIRKRWPVTQDTQPT